MDFALSDDERAVVDAVEQLASSPDPWAELMGGGWLEVARTDVALAGLVGETLGRTGTPLPYISSGVVCPLLLDEPTPVDVRAAVANDGLAEDGVGADLLIVLDNESATVHEDFAVEAIGGLDGDGLARVVELGPPVTTINEPQRLRRAELAASAVAAAELAGHLRLSFELTASHVKVREQFGRPLVGFQVVRHGLSRLFVLAEAGKWLARSAAATLDPFAVHAAKAWMSRASVEASSIAYQLHGATGFTREYPLHRSTKRMRQLRFAWGDERKALIQVGALRRNTSCPAW